jgi:hypothetical protein
MALNYEVFFVIKLFFCEVTHAYCSFKIRPVPVGHSVLFLCKKLEAVSTSAALVYHSCQFNIPVIWPF